MLHAAAGRLDALAEEDSEVALSGAQSGDVVRLVVLVAARCGQAARDRSLGLSWVDHHDAVGGLGVDNGGDVEEVGLAKAIKAELGEDAGHVGLSLVVRVSVTGPALWELLDHVLVTMNGDGVDVCRPGRWGKDDVPGGAVLVKEQGSVVSGDQGRCERGGCEEDGAGKLHLEKESVKDGG